MHPHLVGQPDHLPNVEPFGMEVLGGLPIQGDELLASLSLSLEQDQEEDEEELQPAVIRTTVPDTQKLLPSLGQQN